MTTRESIFIVTKVNEGFGRGHLERSVILANYLRTHGYEIIFIADDTHLAELNKALASHGHTAYAKKVLTNAHPHCIIVDRRETSTWDIGFYHKLAPVIIFDSDGRETEMCDIVIDALPSLNDKKKVNITPFACTVLNSSQRKKPSQKKNVANALVYLGQEVPVIEKTLDIVAPFKKTHFNVIYSGEATFPEKEHISYIPFDEHIENTIPEYDLVITYFGLTAFEALRAGVPVLTIAPTKYHAKLASANEDLFFDLGYYEDIEIFRAHEHLFYFMDNLELREEKVENAKKINNDESLQNIHTIIEGVRDVYEQQCVSCGSTLKKIASRRETSNLYICDKCKTLNRKYFIQPVEEPYTETYYNAAYEAQYGKTYQDDASSIRAFAQHRLDEITPLLKRGRLLDLGCAFGYFMQEAENRGYTVTGCEVSDYAAMYARGKLGLSVANMPVNEFPFHENNFDVVTGWFFFEHIESIEKLFKEIYGVLNPGGVLAFSMPNARGISARLAKDAYYDIIPEDHRYEFSPQGIRLLLESIGFAHVKSVSTGIHFPRFLDLIGFDLFKEVSWMAALYERIAKRMFLGDTFEGYYIRER